MNFMAVISVIVPVYNKEKYLKKTLESLLNQSFEDYEVIIVNDGSTDNSLEIAEEYARKDLRFKVISTKNGGVSCARNIGLKASCGAWIQFLDGDDTITENYLSETYKLALQECADIVFSRFSMINASGEKLCTKEIPCHISVDGKELCSLFIENQYQTGFFGFISNKLISRKLIEKTGATFPVGITLAEDLDFYAHLYRGVEKAAFWDGESFLYLQTDENYLFNDNINYYDQLKIHRDIREWFVLSGMYEQYHCILDRKIAEYVYYIIFYANERGEDVNKVCQELMRDDINVMCASEFKNFDAPKLQKKVLKLFSNGRTKDIVSIFNIRNFIRKIYRKCF